MNDLWERNHGKREPDLLNLIILYKKKINMMKPKAKYNNPKECETIYGGKTKGYIHENLPPANSWNAPIFIDSDSIIESVSVSVKKSSVHDIELVERSNSTLSPSNNPIMY